MAFFLLLASFLPATGLVSFQDQDQDSEFRTQYQAALQIKDTAELGRLIRRYRDVAIITFMAKADHRAQNPSREINEWVDSFVEAWNETYKTNFARHYDRYLQRLDSRRREFRDKMVRELLPAVDKIHHDAISSGSPSDWSRVQVEVETLIRATEDLGDLYFKAYAYNIKGNAWNTALYKKGGDDQRALAAYEEVIAARKRIELENDLFYTQVKKTMADCRARLGIPDPETGKVSKIEQPAEKILPVEGKGWVSLAFVSDAEEESAAMIHPSDLADAHPQTWKVGGAKGEGSSTELAGLEPTVYLRRLGLNEFTLECGGDPSASFKLSPKPTLVRYPRKHASGEEDEHALLLAVGSERDSFQGAGMNLAPTPEHVTVFYRSAATRTCKTEYGPLTIYDLNCDGKFGYEEVQLVGVLGAGYDNTGANQFFVRYDGVSLGKAVRSVPYSRWFPDSKGKWFELESKAVETGGTARIQEVAPKLGKLSLKVKGLKGVKPVSMVFKSETSHTEGLLVDAMAGKSGTMEVPIGTYSFQQGLLRSPKKAEECFVIPGKQPITVEVTEGKTTVLDWGAPFTLDAHVRYEGDSVQVDGRTLRVVGKGGEIYTRFTGKPLFGTQVFVKGGKSAKMDASTSSDINAMWDYAFFPQDVKIEIKPGTKPAVRFNFKKHAWFGQLDSGWLEPSP